MTDASTPQEGAGWLGPLLLLSISLVLGLVLAEVATRVVAPQQLFLIRPDVFQPVDSLGWKHSPDLSTTINTGEGTVTLYTDHRGFRVGREGAVESERSVLVLGDSFMAALQVEYEESLPGLMQAELSAVGGGPVAVRNTGVGGWDPPHYLIKARQELSRKVPELVVVAVYLGNDVVERGMDHFEPRVPFPRPRFSIPTGLSPRAWVEAFAAPMDFRLRQVSHLYVLLRSQLVELRMRLGLSIVYFPQEYLASEAESPRWDVTAAILGEIQAEADAHGVPVIFVLIPAHFQVLEDELARHVNAFSLDTLEIRIDQPNDLLGDRLRSKGLEVLDPLPSLRAAADRGKIPYGRVDSHFNEAGHRVMWDHVRDRVLQVLQNDSPNGAQEESDGP